jgi:hypothetical protein
VPGGYTDRKQPQASKYPLVFWFQGDDHIDQVDAFEASADDPRPWTVKHPFYGNIQGQPLSIKRNDVAYNVTEVTVDFWESINEDYPNPTKSINDVIRSQAADVTAIQSQSYGSRISPSSEDQQILQDNVIQISSTFDRLFDDENFAEYQTAIATARNAAGNLTSDPTNAIDSMHQLLLIPSLFARPVSDRVNSFVAAYAKIKEALEDAPTVNTKLYYESQAGVCIAGLCQATATPIEGDYITRVEIEEITTTIVELYSDYLDTLDSNQVAIVDVQNTYFPAATAQFDLYELVAETTGNLFSLAFQARQQRVLETATETNLILLTHQFLGLDANDENIENFRQLNNIKGLELFKIRKGREIKYFV